MIGTIYRGEVYYADLSPVVGSEQGGTRPVVVVQNDMGNKYSPTVIVAAISSRVNKSKLPTHVEIDASNTGLPKKSVALIEQIRTLDKKRLGAKMGQLSKKEICMINNALFVSLGLDVSVAS